MKLEEAKKLVCMFADRDTARALSKVVVKDGFAYASDGRLGVKVKVLNITGAKDPDEFIQKFGADRFKALIEGAETDTEYKLLLAKAKYDLSSNAGRADYVSEAAQILAALDPVKRDIYASDIAEQTKVSKTAILSECKRLAGKQARKAKREMNRSAMLMRDDKDKINPEKGRYKAAALAEERVIAVLINHPDFLRTVQERLTPEDFVTAFNRHIFTSLADRIAEGKSIHMSAMAQVLTAEELGVLTGLEAVGRGLSHPKQECLESIDTLKAEKQKVLKPNPDDLSDDEFRELFYNA